VGKVLGEGAGGSVRVITRDSDGLTFAVKEFRPRKKNESKEEYAKKCNAEYCVGSTLHHPNIIKTLDILHSSDSSKFFEIMQYCPIDFFGVVMSGRMARSEINCCFKQIVNGVKYLHSNGLAHRDLKLDNCVVTFDGIVKIIDFGSAFVFKYPYEEVSHKATGVVGSDPYLAPEVLSPNKYDCEPVDIWSIGIIYCCMTLRRFPWRCPKSTDSSFKLFVMPDEHPHDYVQSAKDHHTLLTKRKGEKLLNEKLEKGKKEKEKQKENNEKSDKKSDKETFVENPEIKIETDKDQKTDDTASEEGVAKNLEKMKINSTEKQTSVSIETNIKKDKDSKDPKDSKDSNNPNEHADANKKFKQLHGPYRLMRLLPHASRQIISRILEIDPEKRATMKEIYADPWFQSILFCSEDEHEKPVNALNHNHTI
ncbi:putative serine/threonine protein kinase HRK1, partial [Ascoidea rubescens DSM 1968]